MAKDITINSSCQPVPSSITVPKNDKVKIDNQSGGTCTITFTTSPGPFDENPIVIDKNHAKEKVANNVGSWNFTTSCSASTKVKAGTGDGDGIIIVDPPMPGSHGHEHHPKHK